ncbi:MAG: primosomal protein N' [Pseudomonadota bacterium]
MPRLVEVVFPLPIDSTFTYDLPEESENVEIGSRVLAPFGKRLLTGYVVGLPDEAGEFERKTIESVLDDQPLLTPGLLDLTRTMSKMYGSSLGEALVTLLPPGLVRQTRRRILAEKREGAPDGAKEKDLLEKIRKGHGLDFVAAVRRNPKNAALLRSLQKEGWIRIEAVLRKERARVRKDPLETGSAAFAHAPRLELTSEQAEAVRKLSNALVSRTFSSFLLHGITGSGKTEVYLCVAERTLDQGRSVLALVPEIALTPQFVGRFRARFGDKIAVLHSARSESERLTEWQRIRRSEARVVIGARSAVFAPLENIGLVIVDEEHDTSYKQHEGLLYHARDLARFRATKENAVFLLGSATPALETYEEAHGGSLELLELKGRPTGANLAQVSLVDLREKVTKSGSQGIFSEELRDAIQQTLENDEQAVLFLNRRGYAPTLLCPTCGEGLRCKQCSVAMTYHRNEGRLLCHYCGYTQKADSPCPSCGQTKLIPLGIGTERVERELRNLFPDARIARMDRDAVRRRGSHERILEGLAQGTTDILVGTQMVTKGMDFPRVTLVGVLLADQSLHFPDFRAAERTFQLLTQVSGRAGRADRGGRSIIQTFQPEHYAIDSASRQDYAGFYEKEIRFRRELGYPPFTSLCLLRLEGKDHDTVRQSALWLARQGERHRSKTKAEMLGPAPAPVMRVNGVSRFHILVRSERNGSSEPFAKWLHAQAQETLRAKGVELSLDIDPQNFT